MFDIVQISRELSKVLNQSEPVNDWYNDAKGLENKVKGTFKDSNCDWLFLNRPRQNPDVVVFLKQYWKEVGNPLTSFYNRIKGAILSIQEHDDYKVDFSQSEKYDGSLEQYVKERIDLHNWFWSKIPDAVLSDFNGVFYIVPSSFQDEFGLNTPTISFATSNDVFVFESEKFAIIRHGKDWLVFTNSKVFVFTRRPDAINGKDLKDYTFQEFAHFGNKIPCWKAGIYETKNNVKTGFIDGAIPYLRKSGYNWLDIALYEAKHLNPLLIVTAMTDCDNCGGTGTIEDKDGSHTACGACTNGKTLGLVGDGGDILQVPDGNVVNDDGTMGKKYDVRSVAAYLDRPIEPLKLQIEQFQENEKSAYRSVGMEHIFQRFAGQSGDSLARVQEEGGKILVSLSGHIAQIEENIYNAIGAMRYTLRDGVKWKDSQWVSVISPKKLDLTTSADAEARLKAAIDGEFGVEIVKALTEEYVTKVFGSKSITTKRVKFVNKIDPLAGLSVSQKSMSLIGLEWTDYVLSTQIGRIISMSELANQGFWEYPDDNARYKIVIKKAEELSAKTIENKDFLTQQLNYETVRQRGDFSN